MPQSTVEKLGIRAGTSTLVLGQPLADVLGWLGESSASGFVSEAAGRQSVVLLFADTVEDVRSRARGAFDQTAPEGRFWVAYRKGAGRRVTAGEPAPLHRDTLQAALAELGLDGVTLVAIDDTWSAMRVKAVPSV